MRSRLHLPSSRRTAHRTNLRILQASWTPVRSCVNRLWRPKHSWRARDEYIYMERDEDRRLDSVGQVKSENVDVTRMTLVNGIRFEELMEHNGQLPSAEDQKKRDQDLEKLMHETPEEQAARLRKNQESRSFLQSLDLDRILTYSDYRPSSDSPYSVRK